jgi:membrane-bound lytic murein transglycosylase B
MLLSKDRIVMVMKRLLSVLACSLMLLPGVSVANYATHPVALKWLETMVDEGFSRDYLVKVLKNAKRQNSILKAMNRQAEGRLSWEEYRARFIETGRIQNGNKFWKKHALALARAEKKYGVPAHMIVSIIGVETRYGKVTGSYRVLDALATIAFDLPRRSAFFQNELSEFLRLTKQEKIAYTKPKGSYAGAMGYGQFLPSSFMNYAVDFDGDGKRDIWKNPVDAIGSVANYFAAHGWLEGQPVIETAKLLKPINDKWINNGLELKVTLKEWRSKSVTGADSRDLSEKATLMMLNQNNLDQYWFGLQNFYVITRYNRSRVYAMAVYQLSQLIKAENKLS